jgi:hypothetical protein
MPVHSAQRSESKEQRRGKWQVAQRQAAGRQVLARGEEEGVQRVVVSKKQPASRRGEFDFLLN